MTYEITEKEAELLGALYDAGIPLEEIIDKYPQFNPEDIEYAIFGDEEEDTEEYSEYDEYSEDEIDYDDHELTEDIIADMQKLWDNREVVIGGRSFYRVLDKKDMDDGSCMVLMPKEASAFVRRFCHDENERKHFVLSAAELQWNDAVPDWMQETLVLKFRNDECTKIGEWICCVDDLEAELVDSFRIIFNDGKKGFGCQLKDDKDGGRSLCYVVGDEPGKNVLAAIGRFSRAVADCGVKAWDKRYESDDNELKATWKTEISIGGQLYISQGHGAFPPGLAKLIWMLDKEWMIPIGVEDDKEA